jgi:hypothetical protein
MKVCINDKNKTYTGKENSPLGRGYSANKEKINEVMKGKNNFYYKVIKTKNGKKWYKIKINKYIKKSTGAIFRLIRLTNILKKLEVGDKVLDKNIVREMFINYKSQMIELNINKENELDTFYNYIINYPYSNEGNSEEYINLKIDDFANNL